MNPPTRSRKERDRAYSDADNPTTTPACETFRDRGRRRLAWYQNCVDRSDDPKVWDRCSAELESTIPHIPTAPRSRTRRVVVDDAHCDQDQKRREFTATDLPVEAINGVDLDDGATRRLVTWCVQWFDQKMQPTRSALRTYVMDPPDFRDPADDGRSDPLHTNAEWELAVGALTAAGWLIANRAGSAVFTGEGIAVFSEFRERAAMSWASENSPSEWRQSDTRRQPHDGLLPVPRPEEPPPTAVDQPEETFPFEETPEASVASPPKKAAKRVSTAVNGQVDDVSKKLCPPMRQTAKPEVANGNTGLEELEAQFRRLEEECETLALFGDEVGDDCERLEDRREDLRQLRLASRDEREQQKLNPGRGRL